jgi:hypothetical protein
MSIFKNKRFEKIIKKYDSEILNISKSNIDNRNNDSVISQIIRHSFEKNKDDDPTSVSSIFKSIHVSGERLQRYSVYDELYSGVQIIKKIINTYIDNILQTNTYSNNYIILKHSEESRDSNEYIEYRNFCKKLISYYNLEDRFRNKTAFNVLKYGDGFIETVDLDKVTAEFPTPKTKPKRSKDFRNLKIEQLPVSNNSKSKLAKQDKFLVKASSKNRYNSLNFEDFSEIIENYIDFKTQPTLTESESELIAEQKNDDFLSPYNFSKVLLKFHRPHEIVPLTTEYDNIIGYVEIKANSRTTNRNSYNTLLNFANLINQISTTAYSSGKGNREEKNEEIIKQFADIVSLKILNSNNIKFNKKHTISELDSSIKSQLTDSVYYALKKLLISSNKNSLFEDKLEVRYIPPNNMFHFKNPNGDFYPFGTSLIDPLIFPGKLYLLGQLSNAVTKLSRASVLRKWTIETGSREDTNELVQKLKRDVRNKRITVEDVTSSKNIANILSDYRDMITFRKRGQPMLDVDTLQMGNPNINTNDIEDLRNEIIALSGVPGSYLGYQNMSDIREQLVNTNINFANTISIIQHNFNQELSKLFYRVAEISDFKSKNIEQFVKVTLPPPVMLTLQLMESTLNSLGSIQRLFNEIPEIDIDPMYLLRRMCPYIDWVEFEKEAQDFKVRKNTSSNMKGGDDQMGGMRY